MVEPVLTLEPTRLAVSPGGQASFTLTVYNPGTVVEGYDVDVVSTTPVPWVSVTPPTLSVYPQQEATAVVTFSPPAGPGAPGGTVPFGVRVRSQVDASACAVVEGDLDVEAVSGLQATLTPVASTGRWSGRHTVRVSNWGNSPARLRLIAADPDQALGFLVSPEVIEVPLGSEAVARLRVRTRHPVLRGTKQRLPFQVVGEPDVPRTLGAPRSPLSSPDRPVVDGAFNQKPILSALAVALAGLAVAAVIGTVLFFLQADDGGTADPVQPAAKPTGLTGSTVPGIVTLRWDAQQGVDSWVLKQVNPVNDTLDVDPVRQQDLEVYSMRAQTAEEFCYQVVAVVEEGGESEPSDPFCITHQLTPEADASQSASPSATASPSIEPMPGGGGSSPPSSSAPPTESPTGAASAVPLEFASVIQYHLEAASVDARAQAEQQAQALVAQGVPAEVLTTAEWTLDPPPSGLSWVVYVDGATPEAAMAVCQQAKLAVTDLPVDACVTSVRVSPILGTSPTPAPSPTL